MYECYENYAELRREKNHPPTAERCTVRNGPTGVSQPGIQKPVSPWMIRHHQQFRGHIMDRPDKYQVSEPGAPHDSREVLIHDNSGEFGNDLGEINFPVCGGLAISHREAARLA
jgi:hypothetical protein